MMPASPRLFGCFAAVLLLGAGPLAAQAPGLYKDGVLVESMPAIEGIDGDAPAFRLPAPSQRISAATAARNEAGAASVAALAALQREIEALAARGGAPDADELRRLAGLRDAAAAATERLGRQLENTEVPAAAQARQQASLGKLTRARREYLGAIDALVDGAPGSLETALAMVRKYPAYRVAPIPDQPTVLYARKDAPGLTREEADARLEANAAKTPPGRSPAGSEGPIVQGGPLPEDGPPVPDDLAETVEIQFTATIAAKAAELGNSPLEMFEWVRNNVRFEPYLGSRKGAAETLRQLKGNDTDQASLLMALLRVSGYPCRYVRSTIEMTADQAAGWLAVDDPATAGAILTTAGLDGLNIFNGPDVESVRCTRVWVVAHVPYSHYRGQPFADTGRAWIPMDPAFHDTEVHAGEDVLGAMTYDNDTFLSDFIASLYPDSPIGKLRNDVQAWLDANDPGKTLADVERDSAILPENLGLLPASIPAKPIGAATEFATLEDSMRYKVRFHLYDGGTDFIDHTVNLSDIAGKRLTIDYVGATPTDQSIIDSFGGIYDTPPNLVNVRPVLKVDGSAIAVTSNSIGMGYSHSSDMHFMQPTGADNSKPVVTNEIIAGNGQAIGFDTFLDDGGGFFSGDSSPLSFLDVLLHSTSVDYLSRVSRGLEKAGRLMQAVSTQDVSEAIVENSVAVGFSLGVPVSFEWNGLIVDADRRIIGPFPVDGSSAGQVPYMLLTGYDGSNQENLVFEELYDQAAVSTIEILQLASDAGIPVCTITTSIAADCPGFSHPAGVATAVNNALGQGHHVIIPRDPITVGMWSGTGYIDLDPATGAAGYIISGGNSSGVETNGGATVESWPLNLPCDSAMVRNHPDDAQKIKSYLAGEATPTDLFCADKEKGIQFKGKFQVKCPDEDWVDMPFDHTTSKTVKQIAEQFGDGQYTLRLMSNVVLDLWIIKLDLDINKDDHPKVAGTQVPAVSKPADITDADDEKETDPGGYLWVNDDNDHNTGAADAKLDLNDTAVYADDDLEPIKYKVSDEAWTKGLKVKVESTFAAGVVKIWKKNKGDLLAVNMEYATKAALDSDTDDTLYLEGLKSGAGTITFKLMNGATVVCTDTIKATVFAVSNVEWETDGSSVVENDIAPVGNGQQRIFPDKTSAADATARDRPRVSVSIVPSIPAGSGWHVPVACLVRDVDHYASGNIEGNMFDAKASSRDEEGHSDGFCPNDNRTGYTGTDDANGNFGGSGDAYNISIEVAAVGDDTVESFHNSSTECHWSESIGSSGKGKAILHITHHTPCNNWRVAAGCAGAQKAPWAKAKPVRINNAANDGVTLEYIDNNALTIGSGAGTLSRSTKTLTVWRRLHLEQDQMATPVNLVLGTANERSVQDGSVTGGAGTATLATSCGAIKTNQFVNGLAQFYNYALPTKTFLAAGTVNSNTTGANISVTFAAATPATVNHVFITDDDVTSFDDQNATGNATEKQTIIAPDTTLFNASDMLHAAAIHMLADTGKDTTTTTFDLHVNDAEENATVSAQKGLRGGDDYWVATALISFEGPAANSGDGNGASFRRGTSLPYWYGPTTDAAEGGFMSFEETIRDWVAGAGNAADSFQLRNRRTTLHECGHVMGGRHTDGGLMTGSTGTDPASGAFSGKSLRRFMLLRDQGPGKP